MIRRLMLACLAVLVAASPFAAGPLRAQQPSEMVEVRLLPGWRMEDGTHMTALEVRLRPGWKTYWRAPGDAGIPPRFDWRQSRNLSGVELVWPTPSISLQGGVRTIGYSDLLILPMRVTPERAAGDVTLKADIEMGVCRDICIPVDLRVSQTLSRSTRKTDPRIAAAMASRPYPAAEAGVGRVACRLSVAGDGLGLRAEIDMPSAGAPEIAVVEVGDPRVWVAPARAVRKGGRLIAETQLFHVEGRAFALDRSAVRVTVLGQSRAVDIQGCPAG